VHAGDKYLSTAMPISAVRRPPKDAPEDWREEDREQFNERPYHQTGFDSY
jgi:hypothetical protein